MGDISDEENPPYNVSLKELAATIGGLLLSHERNYHGIKNPNRQKQQNEVINQQQ
jgi:hypothetical protein